MPSRPDNAAGHTGPRGQLPPTGRGRAAGWSKALQNLLGGTAPTVDRAVDEPRPAVRGVRSGEVHTPLVRGEVGLVGGDLPRTEGGPGAFRPLVVYPFVRGGRDHLGVRGELTNCPLNGGVVGAVDPVVFGGEAHEHDEVVGQAVHGADVVERRAPPEPAQVRRNVAGERPDL